MEKPNMLEKSVMNFIQIWKLDWFMIWDAFKWIFNSSPPLWKSSAAVLQCCRQGSQTCFYKDPCHTLTPTFDLFIHSYLGLIITHLIYVILLDARKRREGSGSSQYGFVSVHLLRGGLCECLFFTTALLCWQLKQLQRLYLAKIIIISPTYLTPGKKSLFLSREGNILK